MRALQIGLVLMSMVWPALGAARTTPELPTRDASSRQLVLVRSEEWAESTGTLSTYERADDGSWRATGLSAPVQLGRNGTAWGRGLHDFQSGPQKREGDGRAPAGMFALGIAFGYAATEDTAMPYTAMQATHWCIDVTSSTHYNRIVDSDVVGATAIEGSTEPMRLDLHADGDQRYRKGFVIGHNPDHRADLGSCIFAHLWKAPEVSTSGCTAMAPEVMNALLGWLDPKQQPVFVLLPNAEYLRLRDSWRLP